MTMSCRGFS